MGGKKLKRGDEINSLSEAENNSIAGSLLASQMLRRLQDQQLPSAPHRHADDKLKLRHQCLDGRVRGVRRGETRRSDEWESRMKEGVKIDETGCGDERER